MSPRRSWKRRWSCRGKAGCCRFRPAKSRSPAIWRFRKTRAVSFCLRMAAGAAGAARAIRRWPKCCAMRAWRRCSSICSRRKKKWRMLTRGHLRFDIGMLSRRLAIVTKEIADDPYSRNLGIGYFGASTGGAAALRAAAALGTTIGAVVSRGGRPDLAGEALAHVKAPTLLIVGERDEEVLRLNETCLRETAMREVARGRAARHAPVSGTWRARRGGAPGCGLVSQTSEAAANENAISAIAQKPANFSPTKLTALRQQTGRDRARAAARWRAGRRAGGEEIEGATRCLCRAQTRFARASGTRDGRDRQWRRAGVQRRCDQRPANSRTKSSMRSRRRSIRN